jgi:tetratricopeptide (TPR) repeat protein
MALPSLARNRARKLLEERLRTDSSWFEQALPIWQQLGLRSSEGLTLHGLGRLYDEVGDRQKGLELLGLALAVYNGIGEVAHAALVLDKMAATLADLGRFQDAVKSYQEAAQNYLLRSPRDTSRARDSLRRAIELAQRAGLRSQAEAARSTLQALQNPEP